MAGFEITFGTPKHQKILDALMARIRLSKEKMTQRYQHFADMENEFIAYIPESENDKLRKTNRKQQGLQTYTTIAIPYSYSMLMAAHMYWTSVFLSRSPIHQYQGRHGETENKVQAMEALIDYQVSVGQMMIPYYIWLLDAGKYGMGIVGTYWADEYEMVSEFVEEYQQYNGVPLITEKKQLIRLTKRVNTYSGNKVYNIRPQDFLPDPRVPITRFQDGEFAGRRTDIGWNHILKRAAQGQYFNIDRLKMMRSESTTREQGSSQVILPQNEISPAISSGTQSIPDIGTTEAHEMCVELIPRDWELGTGEYPEKWVFTLAQEKVIIGAQPLGLYHSKFPFDVMEYEPDGYALFKRSLLEIVKPLNEVMTWLVNSHFYNVRKALNNQWVVDPSRVTMTDITTPNAGKVIRVKPQAYGQDVRTMITQLPVVDVTRGNLSDISLIESLMQRIVGVADSVMGMPQKAGRRTAAEVRTSSSFSINRLKTAAEYMSSLGFAPHSQKLVQNTLQKYKKEQVFRIAGTMTQGPNMDPYMMVTPDQIAGAYDFVPVDGTMPVDKFAMMAMWNELLKSASQFPEVMGRFDLGEVFAYVAQLGGIKNLKQFQVTAMPDDQLANEAAKGNMVSLRSASGNRKPNTGRTTVAGGGPQVAPTVGRVGSTG